MDYRKYKIKYKTFNMVGVKINTSFFASIYFSSSRLILKCDDQQQLKTMYVNLKVDYTKSLLLLLPSSLLFLSLGSLPSLFSRPFAPNKVYGCVFRYLIEVFLYGYDTQQFRAKAYRRRNFMLINECFHLWKIAMR